MIETVLTQPRDNLRFPAEAPKRAVRRKVGIIPRFHSQVAIHRKMTQLASQLRKLFEEFRVLVRGCEPVWLKSHFTERIAPPGPMLAAPISICDSCLRRKPSPSQRLAAVFFGGSLDFPKNVLLVHGDSPITNL